MWLGRTVADVLEHTGEQTEVIVVLDGAWPDEPLQQHPRLQVVFVPESIGQRAATNYGARLSTAKYIAKLDAHCSVAPGFDVALLEAADVLGDDVTQIPSQDNLHVFDWVCDGCGTRTYQGPTPTDCAHCHGEAHHRDIVWQRRRGVHTTSWRFDSDLKFQYWGEWSHRPEARGDYPETMSCLGACWFINRERFLSLGGLDERHGSWGQMGTEIAAVSWLSGGRMVTNTLTSFAHLFRTQGHGFGFPYQLSGREVDAARKYSQDKWFSDSWEYAVRPLSWLIDHFAPVPGWEKGSSAYLKTSKTQTASLVYYSDCRPDPWLLEACRQQLRLAAPNLPLVSVTLAPVPGFGENLVLNAERGVLTMFRQILSGLEALDTDLVFLVEHDVLYHASHFTGRPPNDRTYLYNQNVWKVDVETGRALHYRCNQTSGLCADRDLLIAHYRARVAHVQAHGFSRRNGFEPGTRQTRHGGFDDHDHATWMSEAPNIDIRHSRNLTASRWERSQFRNQKFCQGWAESDSVPQWGRTRGRFREFLDEVVGAVTA